MALETRSTDAKGRVSLPKAFANATVIIEQVNENELRIRKARVIPEDELRFVGRSTDRPVRSGPPAVLSSARSPTEAERRAAAPDGREGQEAWMSGE